MANTKRYNAALRNAFPWHEITTRDPEAARAFYTELLGWTTSEMPMDEGGTYTLFQKDGHNVAGIMPMTDDWPDAMGAHWMAYIGVDDIDAAAERVEQLGGCVKYGPFELPDVGHICIITDPTGAHVSLFQPKEDA